MHHTITLRAMSAICALTLAACGGSDKDDAPRPPATVTPPPVATSVEVMTTTLRGMESVAYLGGSAYLSLGNSKTEGSAVVKTPLPVTRGSTWTPVSLGPCALGKQGDFIVRAPKLKVVGDDMWLMQPWSDTPGAAPEHSTCTLVPGSANFAPRDQDLRYCIGSFCDTMSMADIKRVGTRLYSNAGAGLNLLTSADNGNTWTVIRGQKASMACTPTQFHVTGSHVLVGGECPLDFAILEAYPLNADGSALASQTKLPITVPTLENRNVQFIEAVPNTRRIFAGVEGGLLRSEDDGQNFKFVIEEPHMGAKNYPYIRSFLPLAGKPDTMVIGGFDKATQFPYLAWSKDGGTTWTDISKLLPNYGKAPTGGNAGMITSISEDTQGRVLVTLNDTGDEQGRLLLLTLGTN